MTQTIRAAFEIKHFAETAFAESNEGPQLFHGTFVLSYHGEIEGEGVLEETKVLFSEKRASMTGLMRFSGRVGNSKGSVVFKHTGKSVNGCVSSTHTVVPGSATGELKGLRGQLWHEGGPDKNFSVLLRYHFA